MTRFWTTLGLLVLCATATFTARPSVYPTGTTIYDPEKAWNGYTLHDAPDDGGLARSGTSGHADDEGSGRGRHADSVHLRRRFSDSPGFGAVQACQSWRLDC